MQNFAFSFTCLIMRRISVSSQQHILHHYISQRVAFFVLMTKSWSRYSPASSKYFLFCQLCRYNVCNLVKSGSLLHNSNSFLLGDQSTNQVKDFKSLLYEQFFDCNLHSKAIIIKYEGKQSLNDIKIPVLECSECNCKSWTIVKSSS